MCLMGESVSSVVSFDTCFSTLLFDFFPGLFLLPDLTGRIDLLGVTFFIPVITLTNALI